MRDSGWSVKEPGISNFILASNVLGKSDSDSQSYTGKYQRLGTSEFRVVIIYLKYVMIRLTMVFLSYYT